MADNPIGEACYYPDSGASLLTLANKGNGMNVVSCEQIVALGGGGFSMEQSPVLDDYILRVCGKERPQICFVPTASAL